MVYTCALRGLLCPDFGAYVCTIHINYIEPLGLGWLEGRTGPLRHTGLGCLWTPHVMLSGSLATQGSLSGSCCRTPNRLIPAPLGGLLQVAGVDPLIWAKVETVNIHIATVAVKLQSMGRSLSRSRRHQHKQCT